MSKNLIKYRREVSFPVLLCYILLLSFSVIDVHEVNLFSGDLVLGNYAETENSGYSYSDENSCPVHFAYSSVSQAVFHNTNFISAPSDNYLTIQLVSEAFYTSISFTGLRLRAPPVTA